MQKLLEVQQLGVVPYQQAWDYQNELGDKVARQQQAETLLLLEHFHTYTLGRRGKDNNLLWSESDLKEKGVTVVWVDRGGDITYHGPGQLVGYPILHLAPIGWVDDRLPQADYVGYIRSLEEVLIRTLADFDMGGFRLEGKTGVWVESGDYSHPHKIASIGVKVDVRGVSRHGFALNVDPDMGYWDGIVPCGLAEVQMTSMTECLSRPPDMKEVIHRTIFNFGVVFDRNIQIVVP